MKHLVIVESPTKAKTIGRFLGKDFFVTSSFGHVRDLPKSKMGVDVEHDFTPDYTVPPTSKKTVTELKKRAKDSDVIYYATDEDREGEAIAWHLHSLLKTPEDKTKRIVFHEITKTAIDEALQHPRTIDENLVNAQQARRIVDRLVGYELSPFLWSKVARGLSAGRVQSVAVRLIVEREEEIEKFKKQEYWTVEGIFADSEEFKAKLSSVDGKKLEKFTIADKKQADALVERAKNEKYAIASVQQKDVKRSSLPPFTTSTLQQDANRKLGFSAKQTMRLAQQLYEGIPLEGNGQVGLITYMRTDAVNLAQKFVDDARSFIEKEYGKEYLPETAKKYSAKSKLAQEAHEAIRPTEVVRTPQSVQAALDPQQFKLYELIWNRAVSCQMTDALFSATSVDVANEDKSLIFRANGSVIKFAGFYKVYPDAVKETLLPAIKEGEKVECKSVNGEQHFTEPPARYSEAGLVKAMEEKGIGRPSTYAPTISTIVDRGYVEKDNRRLKPTDIGRLVNKVLVEHFTTIVDYDFTARMEEDLDKIAEGKKEWVPIVRDFYTPFKKNLVKKDKELDKKDITEVASDEICNKCGKPMVVKTGRFGKFLACTGYPDCKNTINLNHDGTKSEKVDDQPIGKDPSGKDIFVKIGRFGNYIQLGVKEGKKKPKTASLLPGMDPKAITVDQALELLSLPRTLGKNKAGEDVIAANGRFGPYVKAGTETRSLGEGFLPTTITLEQALALLAEPKVKGKRSMGNKTPMKDFGVHEASGKHLKMYAGRYGAYISDGTTNASIPRDRDPLTITLAEAFNLIEEKERKAPRE